MESLKRKGDTQGTQKKEIEQRAASSPLSSQLSALLFSSSPPEPKQAKMDMKVENNNNLNDSFIVEDDLNDLLRELDDFEDDLLIKSEFVDSEDSRVSSSIVRNDSISNVIDSSKSHSGTNDEMEMVSTLNYFTEKEALIYSVYSEADSIYKSDQRLLRMIDISTPKMFSQKAAWEISDLEGSQDLYTNKNDAHFKVLLPETFNIQDLKDKIQSINPNLHLNPIEIIINQSKERRISCQLALMLRDFRQMGSMAQLRLLDGNGNEIVGTLTLSACTELEFKLHFGLILILSNVSIFSPVPGQKYLNITKQNIQSFHYNIGLIT